MNTNNYIPLSFVKIKENNFFRLALLHLLFESIIGISTTSSRGVYSRAAFNRINTVIKELIATVIAVTKHGIFLTLQI